MKNERRLSGWKASNLTVEPGMADRLRAYLQDIPITQADRINGSLSPELISCDEGSMTSLIAFNWSRWGTNIRGEIHGGVIAAMFDTAIGFTAASIGAVSGNKTTTSELQVSYIRPFLGKRYIFETEVIYVGNRGIRLRGIATDADSGKPLATCNANFAVIGNRA